MMHISGSERLQLLLLPEAIDDYVAAGNPAHFVDMFVEGLDWVRRETGRRQRVQVPYDEGVANHIDPESCVHGREVMGEALTRAHVGQPLSDERLPIRSADAFQSAESNMTRGVTASAGQLRVVCRPWHACTSSAREPGGLRTSLVSRMQGLMGKAEGRSP